MLNKILSSNTNIEILRKLKNLDNSDDAIQDVKKILEDLGANKNESEDLAKEFVKNIHQKK